MTADTELEQDVEHETAVHDVHGLDNLIAYLNEKRGFDFAGYKRAGLERRLLKRTRALALATFDEYVDYLEVHPHELNTLFDSVLINATSFFRDATAWEFLTQQVVPQLVEAKRGGQAIRVWSAGCATGQEPYSIAMVLAEALGLDAFARRVKIYATDMDDDALAQARLAIFTPKELMGVPPELAAKYFERSGSKHAFIKEARRSVIFGRHNLLSDAPISRIDLLLCRNTLMYFNAEAQGRILSSIHFALAEGGVLFLGKAEMLLTNSSLFAPIDLKRRLFTKVTHNYPRGRIALTHSVNNVKRADDGSKIRAEDASMRDAVLEVSPIAQIVLGARSTIAIMNEQARKLFGTEPSDVGRPLRETAVVRRLESVIELVERAAVQNRTAYAPACEVGRGSDAPLFVDVIASPLVDELGAPRGTHLSFIDVTGSRRLQQELQQVTQDLEGAYEELQATSEELETTNEELQSTVEELETTNEELQSTNEELETTNEELQSTNEELQGMNETLRSRTSDLGRVNLHFESILASLRSAVVVLDMELHVQVWSDRACDLWGVRSDEIQGKHFFGLDIGLAVEKLSGQIRSCLAGEQDYQEVGLPAVNRKGKAIQCLVKITRLTQNNMPRGIILLMEELELAPGGSSENAHGTPSGK